MLTARENAIIAVTVKAVRQRLVDSQWPTWPRRFARWLSYWLIIDGINSYLPHGAWYISLLIWLGVFAVAEWGWYGELRSWSGERVWPRCRAGGLS